MKKGDWIYVRDSEYYKWEDRIFLANVGGLNPYVCVYPKDESKYPNEKYHTTSYKYVKETSKELPTHEQIVKRWWKKGFKWLMVIGYDENGHFDEPMYLIGDIWVTKDWFHKTREFRNFSPEVEG